MYCRWKSRFCEWSFCKTDIWMVGCIWIVLLPGYWCWDGSGSTARYLKCPVLFKMHFVSACWRGGRVIEWPTVSTWNWNRYFVAPVVQTHTACLWVSKHPLTVCACFHVDVPKKMCVYWNAYIQLCRRVAAVHTNVNLIYKVSKYWPCFGIGAANSYPIPVLTFVEWRLHPLRSAVPARAHTHTYTNLYLDSTSFPVKIIFRGRGPPYSWLFVQCCFLLFQVKLSR